MGAFGVNTYPSTPCFGKILMVLVSARPMAVHRLIPRQLGPQRLVIAHQAFAGCLIRHALDLRERAAVIVGLAHQAEEVHDRDSRCVAR